MHQVAWHSSYTNTAFTRSLSCFACDFGSVCSHYCIKKGKVTFKDTGDQEQARDLEQSDNAHFAQPPQENDLVTGDLVTHNGVSSEQFYPVESQVSVDNEQAVQVTNNNTGATLDVNDNSAVGYVLLLVEYFTFGYQQILLHT